MFPSTKINTSWQDAYLYSVERKGQSTVYRFAGPAYGFTVVATPSGTFTNLGGTMLSLL